MRAGTSAGTRCARRSGASFPAESARPRARARSPPVTRRALRRHPSPRSSEPARRAPTRPRRHRPAAPAPASPSAGRISRRSARSELPGHVGDRRLGHPTGGQVPRRADVLRPVDQPRLGALVVASGAAHLLVVGVERRRHVGVQHPTHVRFVDAHPKRDRGRDDPGRALKELPIARRRRAAPSPAWYSATRSPAAARVSLAASAPAWVPAYTIPGPPSSPAARAISRCLSAGERACSPIARCAAGQSRRSRPRDRAGRAAGRSRGGPEVPRSP